MTEALGVVFTILLASWAVLLDAAPWVLFGFLIAGLVKAFVPQKMVQAHLGGGLWSIVKASAIGVPIPLCSCGVIPAAAGLKKQGAGKGAVASFLVSTPETGIDSMAITYALLDPLMTIFRPVAAFVTAIATGVAVSFTGKAEPAASATESECGTQDSGCSCGCGHKKVEKQGVVQKIKSGLSFAFGELLGDVGGWLLGGVLLAGLISVFVSGEFVERYLSNDIVAMAMMLVISVPMYVCATSSTPIVAALALKGISPGAALVFLLAGPATNAASLPVISKLLGKKGTVVYLAVIIVMSLLFGILVNHLYGWLGFDPKHWATGAAREESGVLAVSSAILLIVLILRTRISSWRTARQR